jgi:hypothetical protein
MSGTMTNKGRKPGKGVDADKLAEALRRAEQAVLRDDKLREEEAKKEKEPKSRPPVELDDSHFTGKGSEPVKKPEPKAATQPGPKTVKQPESKPFRKPEKKSKGLDLDSVLFGDKPKKKTAAKPAEPPKQQPAPPMVDFSKKEEPAPEKPAAPGKKPADRPPPNLGFGELDLTDAPSDAPELELAAGAGEPAAAKPPPPAEPEAAQPLPLEPMSAPLPSAEPAAAPPVERPADSRPPMREPSKEYIPFTPKSSSGRKIKIVLFVVLILAAIGGGIYGFIKWRQSVAEADAAEKAKIENSSLDSLKDDTIKKEKFK